MRLIAGDLSAERGGETVFSGVSFTLDKGELLVVTGPNGAGKTTLLRVIAGLLHASGGSVTLEGAQEGGVGPNAHLLGVQNALKPALTLLENLNFWRKFSGSHAKTVEDALATAGLPGLGDTPYAYLSTGQKRRAAIARLLVSHRPVWLLDEPTSGLDKSGEAMFAGLLRAHLNSGGIAVAATHLALGVEGAKELRMEVREPR
jgi:heme exporter protein A